ncbi:Ion channel [Ostertagia ostertagi]
MMYFANSNAQFFNETDLRKAIDKYDVSMSIKPAVERKKRWDIWGGLYYAGTIYTTIGYGDLAAVTFWGRVFTMVYAIFGIPMVITILNDWGTIMFKTANSEFDPPSSTIQRASSVINWFQRYGRRCHRARQ